MPPPKPKEQKKGKPAPGGKGGKDYLPSNSKPPRDPLAPEEFEQKEVTRTHPLLPQTIFPTWPLEEDIEVLLLFDR